MFQRVIVMRASLRGVKSMILKLNKFLSLICCFVFAASVSHASTLSLGGTLCEGPNSLLPIEADGNCDATFGDGGQSTGPIINIAFSGVGDGTIFGGIRGQSNNLYADVFNLLGNGFYRLTLSSLRFTDPQGNVTTPASAFDATWSLGGTTIGTISNVLTPAVTSLSTIADLSSLTLFNLDASGGDATGGNVMEYKLEIAAVPLPAGMLLLLSGLGGLALARRRKAA